MNFMFTSVLLVPQVPWRDSECPGGCCMPSEFVLQLRHPENQIFNRQTWPNFSSEGDVTFITGLYRNWPLLQRETLPLPSKTIRYTYILERMLQNKSYQCLCSKDVQKHWRPVKICLPLGTLNFSHIFRFILHLPG